MLDWITQNRDVVLAVVALFGAGGAGTVIVKRLLERRSKPAAAAADHTPTARAQADQGGTSIAIGQARDISIGVNREVPPAGFEGLRHRFGLTASEANQLIAAASQAGVALDRIEALAPARLADPDLRAALGARDAERAAQELRRLIEAADAG